MKRKNIGTIVLALFLIVAGLSILGTIFFRWNISWLFREWWTLIMAAVAVCSMASHGPRFWNTYLLGLSALFFVTYREWITWGQFSNCAAALALILVGASLLLRMVRPARDTQQPSYEDSPPSNQPSSAQEPYAYACDPQCHAQQSGEEFPIRTAIFSGVDVRSDCKQLQGGRFTGIFGGVNVDLRSADFRQPITLEVNSFFGGVEILTPPGVRIECTGSSLFGGCDAKAIAGRPYNPAHPPLTVRYFNFCGGTSIK